MVFTKLIIGLHIAIGVINWNLCDYPLLQHSKGIIVIPRADIRPLEIPDEYPLEVRLVVDAIVWEEFEPCSNMFPHVDGEVLNDEVVIIHSSGGESEVFEPYTGICLLGIFGDVGRRSEALWEWRS